MTSRTLTRCLAVCSLTLLALPALADPRFIVRTEVTPSGDGATIAIELACSVEYVGHNPIERGNRLRIQLDVTTLCNGAPPSVASSREMFRPLHAEKARLLELDYDGAAGGARVLTLSFSEDVTFDVFHAGVSDRLSIHVFPMAPVAAPPTPST